MNKTNCRKCNLPYVFLALLLVCDFCYGQSVSRVWPVNDEERRQVCVVEANNKKRYCFDIVIFNEYESPLRASLQNDDILISFGSPAFTAYIDTKWKFDKVSKKLILKNVRGWFPDSHDYDGRVNICEIKGINESIDNIDGEKLFNRLTDDERICYYEYNNLPSLQEIVKRISEGSRDDKSFLAQYGKDVERYKAYLKKYPLSDKNVTIYNNIGYYLEQAGCYDEAIFLLNAVIKNSPQRTVAYLNIADAYWGNNEKGEAKKSYEKYVELMKSQGKDVKKIPQRVYDRIKDASAPARDTLIALSSKWAIHFSEYNKKLELWYNPRVVNLNKKDTVKIKGYQYESGSELVIEVSPNANFLVLDYVNKWELTDEAEMERKNGEIILGYGRQFCQIVDIKNASVVRSMQSDCAGKWDSKNNLVSGDDIIFNSKEYEN